MSPSLACLSLSSALHSVHTHSSIQVVPVTNITIQSSVQFVIWFMSFCALLVCLACFAITLLIIISNRVHRDHSAFPDIDISSLGLASQLHAV
ncbi:hypothetical protein BDR03DRAFT_58095 [Suillus americanus]|nr:hypothetical protein BDR03DRAFT_58095 [Suillus americanus]